MNRTRYSPAFKADAVGQVVDQGRSAKEVASQLGVAAQSVRRWVQAHATPAASDAAPTTTWVLYLIECAGDRLYAGITNDLAARFRAHCDGRGARFTRAFPPVRIVAAAALPSRSAALKAEHALKQQARSRKLRFLAGCGTPLAIGDVRASTGRSRG